MDKVRKSQELKKKEDDKKKKEKAKSFSPIQLKADALSMQNPLGGFDFALNMGVSQTSVMGDVSYSANVMVFHTLTQASVSLAKSKVYLDSKYQVSWIESMGVSYTNNFGAQSVNASFMRLKPMGKWGTVGVGISYSNLFGTEMEHPMWSMGYNLLYTNSFKLTDRLTYAPAFIIAENPLTYTSIENSVLKSDDTMFILSNSFTYRITKRFTINFGYTGIKSTNVFLPLINSFMIGSKIPF